MSDLLERIANGQGVLTEAERAALETVAEATGKPREVYQVYDDTGAPDADMAGVERAGGQHATSGAAVEWAEREGLEAFSVYRESRCITRRLDVWYMQGGSPVYTMN